MRHHVVLVPLTRAGGLGAFRWAGETAETAEAAEAIAAKHGTVVRGGRGGGATVRADIEDADGTTVRAWHVTIKAA